MRNIAEFLDIEINENIFDDLVDNCTFNKMKYRENPMGERANEFFKDPKEFFYKGETKRWKDVLNEKDNEEYRNIARIYMNDDDIHWMETGHFN